ncbi:beta-galactosidase [Coraliomargarita sinensis]|uniref:Beta-galactosidase n=1 Tax=Coraliomargarita sinensis TaxID=2174842 RepID=A0A317ZF64_9BACT|nr:sugar-binding domain-containing protein [Coraliomargarita sinensis]PXA04204.1 beta-galactosidase [Coraliomargarita sinensis]
MALPVFKIPGRRFLFAALILALTHAVAALNAEEVDLSGIWSFELDEANAGVDGKWFNRSLTDTVRLPGTTDENKKGILKDEAPTDRLSRVWYWKGPAWYQREVMIPESWGGKRITLFLERTKNARVWVDDTFIGWDDTLSAPHIHDLTEAMTPGAHTITILVDNSIMPPVGPAHAVDERTQTNWNGVIGRIELHATDPVWIEHVEAYPNIEAGTIRIVAEIGNDTGQHIEGGLSVEAETTNTENAVEYRPTKVDFDTRENLLRLEFTYDPGKELPLWDEFNTTLLHLNLKLEARGGGKNYAHTKAIRFGMRSFTSEDGRFHVNGKPVFLRGRTDCANYPITGYPPMDKKSWLKIMRIHKEWGLNHIRYHSWCPPEAAFAAADELGIYIQAELPNKRSGFKAEESNEAAYHNIDRLAGNESTDQVSLCDYGKREGELILRHFGNSPSFCMFTLGNELGRNEAMFEFVRHFRFLDPRKLYAQGSNNMHWNPSYAEGDDFWAGKSLEKDDRIVRGSDSIFSHGLTPHIENLPPSTMVDYSDAIEGCPVPVIGHETGQFQVYPDFRDIPKFTGVTRARNYEIFRERLKEAGMLDQAQDFVEASGALAAICYREDIEAALRTPGFGGFHLLDIQDFPGQGTALVGMLNVFMEPKGFIAASEWREFCSAVVPLIRMERYTWTQNEQFSARIEVAQYGPGDLSGHTVRVSLIDREENILHQKDFQAADLPTGGLHQVGEYVLEFGCLEEIAAAKLTLKVAILGTPHVNRYPIWLYPENVRTQVPPGVRLTRSFQDTETQKYLQEGGRVLLIPKLDELPQSIEGAFQSDFWSPMFSVAAIKRGQDPAPGTLGFLCDPSSPAFASFPTESHSNWQWWQLNKNSRPIILDATADDFRPLVQMIDNFNRNHKLGLIFETRVGQGSMLVCAIDLPGIKHTPEARQLLRSLQDYVASDEFKPGYEIERDVLDKLFPR